MSSRTAIRRRGGNRIKEKLMKLLGVKSIVTVTLTLIFGYLAIVGRVSGQEFLNVYTIVIAFYFGTQMQRLSDSMDDSTVIK